MFKPTNAIWFTLTFTVFLTFVTEISCKPAFIIDDDDVIDLYSLYVIGRSGKQSDSIHSNSHRGYLYIDDVSDNTARRFDDKTHTQPIHVKHSGKQSDHILLNSHRGYLYIDDVSDNTARRFDDKTHTQPIHVKHFTPIFRYRDLNTKHKRISPNPVQLSLRSDNLAEDDVGDIFVQQQQQQRKKGLLFKLERDISD
ncbi:uncharacterized protein [Musca autumnalis]|uniref:uncharacterized protein n=1 Tax=Musca autumnalis TaxID=221902 RepID=UPI003CF939DE